MEVIEVKNVTPFRPAGSGRRGAPMFQVLDRGPSASVPVLHFPQLQLHMLCCPSEGGAGDSKEETPVSTEEAALKGAGSGSSDSNGHENSSGDCQHGGTRAHGAPGVADGCAKHCLYASFSATRGANVFRVSRSDAWLEDALFFIAIFYARHVRALPFFGPPTEPFPAPSSLCFHVSLWVVLGLGYR